MVRRALCVLAVSFLAAVPMFAGTVSVMSMTASQYDYPYFGAMVTASGTSILGDAHLVVTHADGTTTVVVPDSIERTDLDTRGYYVTYIFRRYASGVVKPGDTLTAVVRDQDASDSSKSAACLGPALSKKKTSAESATCK
jgi:hypothetical protein